MRTRSGWESVVSSCEHDNEALVSNKAENLLTR
jgi:hypothetical protein